MNALCRPSLMLLGLLVLAGCQGSPDGSKERLYDIKGKVTAVDAGKNTVTLDHEDIAGLMKGMEMKFPVADPNVLEGVKPGDQVQGKLRLQSGEQVITELQKR